MSYSSKVFLVLWACMFLATFTTSLVSSPIPYLIEEFVEVPGDLEKTEEATSLGIGIVLALNSVALIIGSFFGGFIADRIGRKKAIILAFTVLASSFVVFYLSQDIILLFVASFMEMLGFNLANPSFKALIADFTSRSSRGTSYGFFNLSWIIAQVPGPVLGGLVADISGLKIPFIFGLSMSLVAIAFSLLISKGHPKTDETPVTDVNCSEDEQAASLMPLKTVLLLFGTANILNGLANGVFSAIMYPYLMFNLQASATEFGLASSLGFGLVTAIVQIPGGKMADKYGRKPLVLSSSLAIPSIVALAFTTRIWQFILLLGVICAIGNISSPAISAWLMDFVPKAKRASVSGITASVNGVGMAIGPMAGSCLWSSMGAMISFAVTGFSFSLQLLPYLKMKETHGEE